MLVIDGIQYEFEGQNFENLEQIFDKANEDGLLAERVITDVFVNDEPFSEIYPHQAEDIPAEDVQSIEIRTMQVDDMAVEITRELYKVVNIMAEGGKQVAQLFRQADDAEALDTYQDLLDVTRNFLQMVGLLRSEYSLQEQADYAEAMEELTTLFSEMSEVLENEDWILLADLIEYEFLPAVEKWKKVVENLREDIRTLQKK